MPSSKQERLQEFYRRLNREGPFASFNQARAAVASLMRDVENEMSGIPENPNAADEGFKTDGRMYPPHDKFEILTDNPRVRTFKQRRHATSFGENGSIQIVGIDGEIMFELAGADGKTISDLTRENPSEPYSTNAGIDPHRATKRLN